MEYTVTRNKASCKDKPDETLGSHAFPHCLTLFHRNSPIHRCMMGAVTLRHANFTDPLSTRALQILGAQLQQVFTTRRTPAFACNSKNDEVKILLQPGRAPVLRSNTIGMPHNAYRQPPQ